MRSLSEKELAGIVDEFRNHCSFCCMDEFCLDAALEIARSVQRELMRRFNEQLPVGRRLEGLIDY